MSPDIFKFRNFISKASIAFMHPVVEQIAKEYKQALRKLYGPEFAELLLYGSYARGDQHSESDVDFAVVLRSPDAKTKELMKTSPIASNLSLKYGLMISTLLVSLQKKQSSMQGIYQNIRREGVLI